jgi:hypothetical protein
MFSPRPVPPWPMRVVSQPDAGTAFLLELPQKAPEALAPTVSAAP